MTVLSLQFVFLAGCSPDPAPEVCSCEGRASEQVEEMAVVVDTKDGYMVLGPIRGYFVPCDPIDENLRVDGLMVTLSLERRATCIKPDDEYQSQKISYGSINAIEVHNDSTFNTTDFRIYVIKSEDYGYAPGFGYRIEHKSGFKIVQPILPAVSGFTTFKTAADAYKTAILVVHIFNQEVGLPSINVEDLEFLKVL